MVYIRYNDQIKKVLKDEELKYKNFHNHSVIDESLMNKSKVTNSINSPNRRTLHEMEIENSENEKNLEKISEKSHEEKVASSEEYNIYDHQDSSDDSIFNCDNKYDSYGVNNLYVLKKAENIRVDTKELNTENDNNLNYNKEVENSFNLKLDSNKKINSFISNLNETLTKKNEYEIKNNKLLKENSINKKDKNPLTKKQSSFLDKKESFEKSFFFENVLESSISQRVNKEKADFEEIFYNSKNHSNKIIDNEINLSQSNFKNKNDFLRNQFPKTDEINLEMKTYSNNNSNKLSINNENFQKSKSDNNNFIANDDREEDIKLIKEMNLRGYFKF